MKVPRLWGQRKESGGKEEAESFLESLARKEERWQFRGRQGFCKMTFSKFGKANAFFSWGEATSVQISAPV